MNTTRMMSMIGTCVQIVISLALFAQRLTFGRNCLLTWLRLFDGELVVQNLSITTILVVALLPNYAYTNGVLGAKRQIV
ncbi:hypothetical protein BpHYR1_027254 [Brachionus plicatilis]|uniref:Uncharacterized protein n=1 Tax=Brachionus plicatilis TaxID=10195 RepID=A0A3M7P6A1_BRAPC|nr:hypothetical protein BpHYR1_027254 [Brachionus plicatilis]